MWNLCSGCWITVILSLFLYTACETQDSTNVFIYCEINVISGIQGISILQSDDCPRYMTDGNNYDWEFPEDPNNFPVSFKGVNFTLMYLRFHNTDNNLFEIIPKDTNDVGQNISAIVENPVSYFFDNSSEVKINLLLGNWTNDPLPAGTLIDFGVIVELFAETDVPTTTVTPEGSLTVHFQGKQEAFKNVSDKFKQIVRNLAVEYCDAKNIKRDNTTEPVVGVEYSGCPQNWPEYENCIEVILSIKINVTDIPTHKELTYAHLEEFWKLYGEGKVAKMINLSDYTLPDMDNILGATLGGICALIAVFVIVLIVGWKFNNIKACIQRNQWLKNRRRKSNSGSILTSSPMQEPPPLIPEDEDWYRNSFSSSISYDRRSEGISSPEVIYRQK